MDPRNGISRIMEQETVAKKTKISYPAIGKGRYGAVYLGNLHGDNVAVKIFTSKEEASWSREVRIYQTVMLQHENILRFIAADNKDAGTCTELWLITEYHENGSLFNYLSDTTLNQEALFKIAYSICCGLAHLHTEMIGIRGKPAIAHRDIKSNNILVKKDGSCAIGDLGLAVCYYSKSNTIDIPSNERVGTRRYMPPEVIEDTLNMRSFDAFKNADIYSFGLVLWEVLSRSNITGTPDDYAPCFSEMVPHDPSIEEMRRVVVVGKRRPRLKKEWEIHPFISPICKIIRECWSDNNESRLPVLRVKKTLHSLLHSGDMKI
ncbi:uncharacterized protein TRIADDRAFT_22033 [Trichoplax adhaerens]|uniref:receptor protein serine/threonine kinase n=1 Tax=Trichoplax adhaerens TaxID=10228 RepID=B3RRD8_TRIAD|nr:hypothetical protein TRIADDRAFT_22033 [Trichoplax adhaerens]EDV26859.1 hypothetical protein TRIADDRAFT_22033 [Trichoplax adhaerens]|eukprot:XP_002110855.1 hypothetical protein TRIADDRAFT_22033 [Trichoplax adhaerens]